MSFMKLNFSTLKKRISVSPVFLLSYSFAIFNINAFTGKWLYVNRIVKHRLSCLSLIIFVYSEYHLFSGRRV